MNDMLLFATPLVVGVITFFAYKFLSCSANVTDLHHWYGKTDHKGVLLGYKEDGEAYKLALSQIVAALHEHVSREEKSLAALHEKIDRGLLRQGEVLGKIDKMCQ